jgi:hypothetical protein
MAGRAGLLSAESDSETLGEGVTSRVPERSDRNCIKAAPTVPKVRILVNAILVAICLCSIPIAAAKPSTLCDDMKDALAQAPNFPNFRLVPRLEGKDTWITNLKIGNTNYCYLQQFGNTAFGLICEFPDFDQKDTADTAYNALLSTVKICAQEPKFSYRSKVTPTGNVGFFENGRDRFAVSLSHFNVLDITGQDINKQIFKIAIAVYSPK